MNLEKMFHRAKTEPSNSRTQLKDVIPLNTPYMVFIDPSGACNFHCNFCPCNDAEYMELWEERHKIMSFELFAKIVEDLKQFDEPIRVIALQSLGEPMLNKDLCKMIRYLKDSNVCREIRMFTNGSMLSPEINSELVNSGLDYIRISIESLYESDYKSVCKYNIRLSQMIQNIEDLYKKSHLNRNENDGMRIAVKLINLTLQNEDDVDRFYDIYSDISDYHYIERIENRWSQFEIKMYPKIFKEAHGYVKRNEVKRMVCSKAFWTLCIQANGAVCPCSTDWKHANVLGNVNKQKLLDIWNSEKMRDFRIKQLNGEWNEIPFCRDCGYWVSENLENYQEDLVKMLTNQCDVTSIQITSLIDTKYEKTKKIVICEKNKWKNWTEDEHTKILIFGAGEWGKALYWRCKCAGIKVDGFVDNDCTKWNSIIVDGVICFPKEEIVEWKQEIVYLIGIGDSTAKKSVRRELCKLGYENIYEDIFEQYILQSRLWSWSDKWLESDITEIKQQILSCVNCLEDDLSKRILYLKLKFMFGEEINFANINSPYQYFLEKGKFLNNNEIIIDCGAFNGDTLRNLLQEIEYDRFEKYICFEVDKVNCKELVSTVENLNEQLQHKIQIVEAGVGEKNTIISYGENVTNSRVYEDILGDAQGQIVAIDEYLRDDKVSFIKMDIEGFEREALMGCRRIISEQKPQLAICIYHKVEDIWEIQQLILSIVPEYKFIIRHHSDDETETVLYARIGGFSNK